MRLRWWGTVLNGCLEATFDRGPDTVLASILDQVRERKCPDRGDHGSRWTKPRRDVCHSLFPPSLYSPDRRE
jgi:hypothetical protein